MTDINVNPPRQLVVEKRVVNAVLTPRTTQLAVVQRTSSTEVTKTSAEVVISAAGPAGPRGAAGGEAFVFTQSTPASTWTVNHDLGFKPTVELMTAGGLEFEADIQHLSDNHFVVNMNTATAGTARCI